MEMFIKESKEMKWTYKFKHEGKRRRFTLHYITQDEVETLLVIAMASPRRWAKQIIRRNQRALKALRSNDTKRIRIGCPHCRAVKLDCDSCAFVTALSDSHPVKEEYMDEVCVRLSFGGIRYMNTAVFYKDDSVEISSQYMAAHKRMRTARFLLAHIEWARKMIAVYGT